MLNHILCVYGALFMSAITKSIPSPFKPQRRSRHKTLKHLTLTLMLSIPLHDVYADNPNAYSTYTDVVGGGHPFSWSYTTNGSGSKAPDKPETYSPVTVDNTTYYGLFFAKGSNSQALYMSGSGSQTFNDYSASDSSKYQNYASGNSWNTKFYNSIEGLKVESGSTLDFSNLSSASTVVNVITGGINVNRANIDFSNKSFGSGTVTNSVSGGINISSGGSVDFSNQSFGSGTVTNTITGSVVSIGGFVNFANQGNGSITNTITGGVIADSGSWAVFSNGFFDGAGTGAVTNTITGGVTVNNSLAIFCNLNQSGDGTVTNSIDRITLNSGLFALGGANTTTNIGTFNWNSGELIMVYSNGTFGNTTINTLNIGDGSLSLLLSSLSNDLTTSDINGTQTILTAGTITGNLNNITLTNESPFFEVLPTNEAPTGIYVTSSGEVSFTAVPAATTGVTNAMSALDHANEAVRNAVQNVIMASEQNFAPSSYQINKQRQNITRIMNENRKNTMEGLITALARDNAGQIIKIRGDYRLFATPFVTRIRNNGCGGYKAGFTEKFYGLLMGGTRYFKESGITLLGMIGVGASKQQMDRSPNSYTNGKNIMVGVDARKTFLDFIDFESNLSGIVTRNNQWRQGNPSPSQSYIAQSRYNTYSASFKNEVGPIFKLDGGFSIKPDIGLQLNISKQTNIAEFNAASFAQNYKAKVMRDGEIYGGVGVRKQWKSDEYEGKLTLKYEVGQKSGNGKNSSTIYTDTTRTGASSTGNKAGSFTQYINLYGSFLNLKYNIKVVPGVTMTLQKGQNSVSGTVKFEYRF